LQALLLATACSDLLVISCGAAAHAGCCYGPLLNARGGLGSGCVCQQQCLPNNVVTLARLVLVWKFMCMVWSPVLWLVWVCKLNGCGYGLLGVLVLGTGEGFGGISAGQVGCSCQCLGRCTQPGLCSLHRVTSTLRARRGRFVPQAAAGAPAPPGEGRSCGPLLWLCGCALP